MGQPRLFADSVLWTKKENIISGIIQVHIDMVTNGTPILQPQPEILPRSSLPRALATAAVQVERLGMAPGHNLGVGHVDRLACRHRGMRPLVVTILPFESDDLEPILVG